MKPLIISLFMMLSSISHGEEKIPSGDFAINPETSQAIPSFSGDVVFLRGSAVKKVKGRDYELTLKMGSRVLAGETIQTSDKSVVKIKMVDDSVIAVGPSSTVTIEKFDYETKDKRSVVLNLIRGKIRGEVNRKVERPHTFEIKTNQAAMGVRGTEFLSDVYLNENFQGVTQFALLSGQAEVTNKVTQKKQKLFPKQKSVIAGKEGTVDIDQIMELSDSEFNELVAASMKGEDGPGFLNKFDPYGAQYKSKSADSPVSSGRKTEDDSEGTWKKNLEKLNDDLKDGQ